MYNDLRLLVPTLAAAAALLTLPATAAPIPDGDVQRIEISAPTGALLAAEAVLARRDLESAYAMSTGRKLTVKSVGDSLDVRYGRRIRAAMQHDGRGRFVSRDGQLSLQFQLDETGDPQLVRLSLPTDWQ